MKKSLVFTLMVLLVSSTINAQNKVREKDLYGTWQLIIDIDEEFEEAKEEADNSILGSIILNSVSGMVSGLMSQIEIYMNFQPENELRVTIDAFGEKETEYSKYEIEGGRLYVPDNEKVDFDMDDYWLMESEDLLVLMDDGEINRNVYMVRLD